MHTNSKLAKSVRLALMYGATATAFSGVSVAVAQDQADTNTAERTERIQVTGSRLRQSDIEGANPVSVISGDELTAAGVVDLGDYVQRMPAMSGSPIGTTTNNGGSGAVTVNLRGLGSARTLVLVNGRRTVDGGDFQTIPTSAVERIEILKEGASTAYGADAVAGVVNVILKNDFDGVRVSYQRKEALDVSGSTEEGFSVLMGRTFNGGNFTAAFDYAEQDPIYQGDVSSVPFLQNPWYIEDPESFRQNGLIPPGTDGANVFASGSSATPCGWFQVASRDTAQTLRPCMDADGGASWDPSGFTPTADDYDDFVGGGQNNDTYNFAPVNYLQTPYTKFNGVISANMEVNRDVNAYADIRFNKRTSAQELAPTPFFSIFDTPGLVIPEDNYYNPFGEDVLAYRRRINDNGASRRFDNDVTQIQTTLGLEGVLANQYYWDVSYSKGYRTTTGVDFGQLYSPNLADAIGPSFEDDEGNIVCGTPDAVIDGCVPFNFFGGTGSISEEMLAGVSAPLVDNTTSELDQLIGNISGDIMELPAGALQLAVGYEYRREELVANVDSGKFMESVSGNTGAGVSGNLTTNSQYLEASIPLLAYQPFAEMLEAKVGIRRDDNSIFGDNVTTSLGIRWQPVSELLVRGTYGDVFRAPTVGNLFSPAGDSFPSATDPCSQGNWGDLDGDQRAQCIATGAPADGVETSDTQVRARVGGNPDLQPEEGTSLTLGFAYSPDFLQGFNVTVDYWSFDIDDVISSVTASQSLTGCYTGFVDALCDNINRVEGTGFIESIDAAAANLANQKASGVDTEISYSFDTDYGRFRTFMGWTHLLERETTRFATQGFAVQELKGYHDLSSSETYAENKINFRVDWVMNNWTANYAVEWIDGVDYEANFFEGGFENIDGNDKYVFGEIIGVPSQIYHDVTVAYDFAQGSRVSVGITNLFDKAPPFIDAGFNASTDPSTYRLFGRTAFLRLSHEF